MRQSDKLPTENRNEFLQSPAWARFQSALGKKVWQLDQNSFSALIIKHKLPLRKNYLYCPRGPIIKPSQPTATKDPDLKKLAEDFLKSAKEIAKKEKAIFLKLEPNSILSRFDFQNLPSERCFLSKNVQPQKTIILDLAPEKTEIMKQMHPKTRYNIRLAQKKDLEVKMANKDRDLSYFLDLLKKTAKRDGFRPHQPHYYQKMARILCREKILKIFFAYHRKKIIAANLVIFYNNKAVYLHGASNHHYRKLMAPYLLQWQALLEAKQRGLKYYDFWGIDENKWPGVTRFKKGFGGREVVYPQAADFVYQPFWYHSYQFAKKLF